MDARVKPGHDNQEFAPPQDEGGNRFATFNAIYEPYFAGNAPSRIFMYIHSWPGPFDVEIDCVAVI